LVGKKYKWILVIIKRRLYKKMQGINKNSAEYILSCLAKRHDWELDSDILSADSFQKYNIERSREKKYSKEKYMIVKHIICKIMNTDYKVDYYRSLPENHIFLDGEKCYLLITLLEKEFKSEVNIENIYYTSVYSFNAIIDLFFER